MSVSTAPAFKAALIVALRARMTGDFQDVQITWGSPAEHTERELVWMGRIEQDEVWSAIGHLRRDETYVLMVEISVVRSFLDDPQATDERALAIYEELAAALRADPTVGGVVGNTQGADVLGYTLDPRANSADGWREAALTVRIRVRARI